MKKIICIFLFALFLSGCASLPAGGEEMALESGSAIDEFEVQPTTARDLSLIIIEPNVTPAYRIIFELPVGWTYEYQQNDDDNNPIMVVKVKPKTQSGGIEIGYSKDCEMSEYDLSKSPISLNGAYAWKGIYGDEKLWSFITLRGEYEGCYIYNLAKPWYQEYKDDIGQLVSSIRFAYIQ